MIKKNGKNNIKGKRKDLSINEKRFRALVEHSPAGLLIVDKMGKISFAGPSTENLLGYIPEEVIGRSIIEFIHKEDRLKAVRRLGLLVGKPGAHTTSDYRVFHKDGSLRHLEVTGTNLFNNDAIKGVALNYRDITEERAALEAVKNLAAIVENSEDAIIGKNLDGTVISWNKGAEVLYGYKREEIIGENIFKVVPKNKQEEEECFLKEARAGKEVSHRETTRKRKDGTLFHASVTVSPIRDEKGNIVGASSIVRDITQKKTAQTQERFLAKATSTLSSSLDYKKILKDLANISVPAIGDWCVVNIMNDKDLLDRVVVVHKDKEKEKFAKMLEKKYPPDPSLDLGIYKVVRSGKGSLYKNVTEEMIEKTTRDKEHEKIIKNLGITSSIAVPLKSRGKVIGAISFVRAGDSAPYSEEELAFAEELGIRAGFAIDNAILYQDLEDSNRMKDAFLASLAHELRNPLAPIVSSLEIMRMEDVDNEEIREGIRTIERHIKNTTHILDDLLDLSRINQGLLELHEEVVDINTVVRHAVETSRSFIEKQEHNLKCDIPNEPLYAKIDAIRMEQVLINLLNNASKYTPKKGNISLTYKEEGDHIVLSVKDNGKGIHKDFMPYIFDIFMQADKRLNRSSQGGLGIGLSLVRTIVEMHGGSISAHSEGLGKGSEFVVRIPAYNKKSGPKEDIVHAEHEHSSRVAEPIETEAPKEKILIVDDNQDAAHSLAKLLSRQGYDVVVSHSGLDALSLIEKNKPSTVLLDIGLPGLDGYEVAKRIRTNERGEDILLVAITGYGQDSDREKAKKAGFDYHITKPVAWGELRDLLDKHIAAH